MKKFLTFILVVLATFAAGRAQMRYQSQNAPDVEVTLVSGGVVINLDGTKRFQPGSEMWVSLINGMCQRYPIVLTDFRAGRSVVK